LGAEERKSEKAKGKVMTVDLETQRGFVSGTITPLPTEGIIQPGRRSYDMTADGKYFVVVMVAKSQTVPDKAPAEQIDVTSTGSKN
jgi:hypothetical protein